MNGNCWHKSSYSGNNEPDCVEVAEGSLTLVRDTQNRHLDPLPFPAREWDAFLQAVKGDEL